MIQTVLPNEDDMDSRGQLPDIRTDTLSYLNIYEIMQGVHYTGSRSWIRHQSPCQFPQINRTFGNFPSNECSSSEKIPFVTSAGLFPSHRVLTHWFRQTTFTAKLRRAVNVNVSDRKDTSSGMGKSAIGLNSVYWKIPFCHTLHRRRIRVEMTEIWQACTTGIPSNLKMSVKISTQFRTFMFFFFPYLLCFVHGLWYLPLWYWSCLWYI